MSRNLKQVLLAAAMILALSGLTLAHDENSQGSYVGQRGFQQGYSDGFQHGREDRDRGAGYDYQGDDYRRAGRGYDPDSGDRDQFVAAYREGYRSGYDDGYKGRDQRSNGPYDRGGYGRDRDDRNGDYEDDRDGDYDNGGYGRQGSGYRDLAYDTGYWDGVDGAQSDIRENKRFDVNSHGWYRDADHGYSSGYGSRELYRQQYRQGYEAGYRDGFNRQRYGNGGYRNDRYGGGRRVDAAYAQGYNDGIVGARKDIRRYKSPDPTRHEWYRDANRGSGGGYYRDRASYRRRYREGYIAGYNDTYSYSSNYYGGYSRRGY